ncbi:MULTISPECIES: NAD-dependent succinate-semialdehyde dehydrogenase [Paenarthrobacter]|uniref:NAD-dependent succinate-semialdehyde dehydrogenase n=1 Tax=Paenarthrobacter ureafaciens TaxID=37931 RepID=A0AAX3EN19_PAEUR|nr:MULTISPECIES: NAD-dependent succinate-semialdehyde dehydrogenase [Paenarthrobacter]NKR14061.1 NAD-dependent succinate-semialdehyde dehydrogenase [Arthrobacter sp. M5]NKR18331.1 NAD-dependent succinate-semialdehyde dehydrogenase [Arthrobacter sp. M6]OEH59335.1 NAD-dependent succinate-semialdehyde dehydrogenase [Arthrobacter sp. D2]OEH60682.1 NAD-dependent succinate-semialdehyde dehydrogenase [Arthrobacter sp. D4]MDO5864403.1 NAD-dependent succinate-semialdehyde dehydrogenase [Paenarthrobacte
MTLLSTLEPLDLEGLTVPRQLLIAGRWRDAAGGGTVDVVNPSDATAITAIADADVADGLAAVDAAADALADWAATPPRQRAEVLSRCFDLMTERSEELARLISLENGKALPDARGEVAYAAEFFRWYAEEAVRIIGDMSISPSGTNRILVQHQPIGVCVLITPWNFPAAMATRKLAPALAAGCTAVLKPATLTPLTSLAIAQLMVDAGVPAGVVNVVTTSKTSDVMTPILADPRVRKLSFTGSTGVGRHLLRQAADNVLKCSMELGGNAPFLVFEDADLDKAIDGVMVAKMRNGGQACTAANRIYVQRGIQAEFAGRLAARMAGLTVGPGTDPATEVGPLVDEASVMKVDALVRDALNQGARLLTGGQLPAGDGYYYPPTVLTNVPLHARMVSEEIFGPVASIIGFDTEEEAVAAANDSEYGLAAYVFTEDFRRGLRIAERIESGMVAVNRGLVSDPAAPFGGVKQSGLGREGAHQGLLDFTETKYIAVDW